MKAKDIISNDPVTIGRNESLVAAQELMREHNIRHIIVLEDAAGYDPSVVGVLSERDICQVAMSKLIASGEKAQRAFLATSTVKQAMKTEVVSVDLEAPIAKCAELMAEKKIGCLPVIEGEELKGVITKTDLLKLLSKE